MPTPSAAYENSVQRQDSTNARLQPADYGAAGEMLGRAAQGFGQDLKEVSAHLEEREKRDAEVAARDADNIRMARRLKRLYEGPEGYFNTEGKATLNDRPNLERDLAAIDADVGAGLKNQRFARQMFDDMSAKRANDDMPKIYQHESQQRSKYEEGVDADAFDLAIDNASTSLDPVVIEENIATVGNIAVRKLMRSGNYDENAIKQARQAGVGKAIAAVADQMNLKSPSEAQAFVVHHAKDMDPQDAAKLMDQLAPSAASEQADEKVGGYLVLTNDRMQANPQAEPNPVGPGNPVATPIPDFDAVAVALLGQETHGGAHTNPDGSMITSYAGAQGTGQIMPGTGPKPGYGVKPLQNHSQAEHVRFSKDLLAAYTKHFGNNIVRGLTAYNWGPGNLEAHLRKVGGDISDAAFINSLPLVPGPTEAARNQVRNYAEQILGRVGVRVGGKVDPSVAQAPTYQGQEVNLVATFAKIDADPDLTYVQKKALKESASRTHSLGQQAKAEAENRLKESVSTWMNTLPDPEQFTNFDSMPLNLRTQLATNPDLEAAYRARATNNRQAAEAKTLSLHNAEVTRVAAERDHATALVMYGNPEAFKAIDFSDPRNTKGMSLPDIDKWMNTQKSMINSEQGKGKTANYDSIRTVVGRFAGKKPPADIGKAFEATARLEEAWIQSHPNTAVPDAVREGFARQVMTQYTLATPGKLWGETTHTVKGYQLDGRKPTEQLRVDSFEVVKAQLQQIWQRTPTDAEVQREIATRSSGGGLRL